MTMTLIRIPPGPEQKCHICRELFRPGNGPWPAVPSETRQGA